MRKSIEGETVNRHEDGSGETRLTIEFNPVGVVIVRHGILNYSHAPCSSFIPLAQSQKDHYVGIRTMGQGREKNKHGIDENDWGR
jgi:hypothetical protein